MIQALAAQAALAATTMSASMFHKQFCRDHTCSSSRTESN
eukprot:CAMPEP_0175390930 /NCGR_PEP_ID=MMETSP0095-20121207/31656_1 /TAXON_ID=311494 /ORGANISM="Alexandrium monilatum, Strain CCMP3105" /LENGTH=39 /DNA_ID= /DNA_START= /DNA_END= /DNA_ORIENTATION=